MSLAWVVQEAVELISPLPSHRILPKRKDEEVEQQQYSKCHNLQWLFGPNSPWEKLAFFAL